MAQPDNRFLRTSTITADQSRADVDQGLRSYMLSVYNYMAGGVALTGIVAYAVNLMAHEGAVSGGRHGLSAFGQFLYNSPMHWVIAFLPLAFMLFGGTAYHRMSVGTAQAMFWLFSALMGLSLSVVFLVFSLPAISQAFFCTAAAFAGLSLYGYTTTRSLSGIGSFLIMGVVGLIAAMIVNIFLASGALAFAISVIGVLVFAGLTAYDTQSIKDSYSYVAHDGEIAAKSAIGGALQLYLDFINLFQFILQLMGTSRD